MDFTTGDHITIFTKDRQGLPTAVRAIVRSIEKAYFTAEIIEGPDDGAVVVLKIQDRTATGEDLGIPGESPGFAESDDAGEDWKGRQP